MSDYSVAFTSLRRQCVVAGLDANTEEMRVFLMHIAELLVQERQLVREYERIINNEVAR